MLMAGVAIGGTIVQLRCSIFYYPMLKRLVGEHLWFVAIGFGFGALYLLGAIDLNYFLFAVVFTSFRICGTYVLRTIVKESYDGRDWGLVAFLLAIYAVHYGIKPEPLYGVRITNLLAALSCAYAIARNFQDFARHYGALKPRAT